MKNKKIFMWIGILVLLLAFFYFTWPTRDIYISDTDFTVLKAEWSKPALDTTIDGNPLQIGGKAYTKGLGVHADSEISVPIPDEYTHFIAEIGVDDEIAEDQPASVYFRVMGDNAILYESPLLTASDPPHRLTVNLNDIKQLILQVSGGEDGKNADHADWAQARFTKM